MTHCKNTNYQYTYLKNSEMYNLQVLLFICPISVLYSDDDRQTKYLEMNRVNTARKSTELRASMYYIYLRIIIIIIIII